MFDSEGQCISTLEKLLDEKREKRSCFEKYFCCYLRLKSRNNV